MTTPVRAVHADEPVSFAARQLVKSRPRRLFVVDWDGRLVAVVARRDLLRMFTARPAGTQDASRVANVQLGPRTRSLSLPKRIAASIAFSSAW